MTTKKLKDLGITQNEYNNMLSIQKYGYGMSQRLNTAMFNKDLADRDPLTRKMFLSEKGKEIMQKVG